MNKKNMLKLAKNIVWTGTKMVALDMVVFAALSYIWDGKRDITLDYIVEGKRKK